MQSVIDAQITLMQKYDLDALIAMTPENFGYTAGVMVPTQTTVRTRHAIHILTKDQYQENIVVNIEEGLVKKYGYVDAKHVISYNEFTQNPVEIIAERLNALKLNGKRVGIELNYIPYKDFMVLQKAAPDTVFVDAQILFEDLRKVKLEHEIKQIRHLAQNAEDIIYAAFNGVCAGNTENDMKNIIQQGFSACGGDKLTVLTIGSGERSCMLNAPPTDRVLQKGDVVRVDLVGTAKGYYVDVCRTCTVGEASDEQKNIWSKLVTAHDNIINSLKPGVDTKEVYDSYRKDCVNWGFDCVDFVGHGLGLSLHEEPYIGRYAHNILREGMAMCVEPIAIFEPVCAYHLENEVLITRQGYEVLSAKYPYDKMFTIKA